MHNYIEINRIGQTQTEHSVPRRTPRLGSARSIVDIEEVIVIFPDDNPSFVQELDSLATFVFEALGQRDDET